MQASPRLLARYRVRLLVAAGLAVLVWIAFFDSHSLQRRATWWQETKQLRHENDALRERIQTIESSLERGLTDEDVERIAREQYGMRRPGETVYPQKHER
jgi:cell division protein FtsB